MPQIIFIQRDGTRSQTQASAGQSLLEVAKQNHIDIEGACGGAMACSTCHLIIDPAWVGKLPKASEDETDMLDLAPGITKTSRLGCQIRVTDGLNGLIVKLPPKTKSLLG